MALCLVCVGANSAEPVPVVRFHVERFVVDGENPLGTDATQALLAPFIGDYEGLDGLLSAADTLEQALAELGYAFHRVVLPPQTLDSGKVHLKVVVFKLGKITVTGNKYFPADNVRRSLPRLQEGATPNVRALARDVDFANLGPSKTVAVTLKDSELPDSVDADVKVADRKPWQVFGLLNNIGTEATGELRMTVGGSYSNLWNLDHRATFTYTTAPDNASSVSQYGFNYQAPLYGDTNLVSFFFIDSTVDSGSVADFFDVSGAGRFVGGSFNHLLPALGAYRHDWTLTFQDKDFTNDVRFNGVPIGTNVRSRPISIQYSGSYRTERLRSAFYLGFSRNMASGENNDDATYAASRFNADANWIAFRLGGNATYDLASRWMLRGVTEMQISAEPLIAGEQFGVGGASSVRGFDERAVSGDSGLRLTAEVWTPSYITWRDISVRGLAFLDYGWVVQSDPAPGTADEDVISSGGVGFRAAWRDQLGFNVDYGHSINGVQRAGALPQTIESKWNFSLFYRF